MTDYLKIYNDKSELAISALFSSWHLTKVEDLDKYLLENFISDRTVEFKSRLGVESLSYSVYRAFVQDDNSIIVLSNPSDTPVYIRTGYGPIEYRVGYADAWPIYEFRGVGLGIEVISNNLSVVKKIKVLTFSPTININDTSKAGIQIFSEKAALLYSSSSSPLKIITNRRTNYSDSPRNFYYGYDDVQDVIYDDNNYFEYSGNKTVGYFGDIITDTSIYRTHRISHLAAAPVAKLTKNSIMTGVLNLYLDETKLENHLIGTGDTQVYDYTFYGVKRASTCEQSTFCVFDVTNCY